MLFSGMITAIVCNHFSHCLISPIWSSCGGPCILYASIWLECWFPHYKNEGWISLARFEGHSRRWRASKAIPLLWGTQLPRLAWNRLRSEGQQESRRGFVEAFYCSKVMLHRTSCGLRQDNPSVQYLLQGKHPAQHCSLVMLGSHLLSPFCWWGERDCGSELLHGEIFHTIILMVTKHP